VPEKREEVTTEGGLDVVGAGDELRSAIERLKGEGIQVNLFIDAVPAQIQRTAELGADGLELHTGPYALASEAGRPERLAELTAGAVLGANLGLYVAAGHGLNYLNVTPVAALPQVAELNIGHSIISRAIFVGLDAAVREMRELLAQADARNA
jgi:pyridoxine 5-phosphate synthase